MTEKAIELLSQNKNGYFLFVEGFKLNFINKKRTKMSRFLEINFITDFEKRCLRYQEHFFITK